jgi:uncharacterized protein YciI
MLFVVRFVDHPERLAVRRAFMTQHLAWLEQHRDVVLVAGSLRAEAADKPVGACWIVRADTRRQVQDLLRTDPFWMQGLRQSTEVMLWSKAFPDREVLV